MGKTKTHESESIFEILKELKDGTFTHTWSFTFFWNWMLTEWGWAPSDLQTKKEQIKIEYTISILFGWIWKGLRGLKQRLPISINIVVSEIRHAVAGLPRADAPSGVLAQFSEVVFHHWRLVPYCQLPILFSFRWFCRHCLWWFYKPKKQPKKKNH